MAIGDVYQIKVSQIAPNIGDEALNIFFYRLDTGIFLLDDFINQFILSVILNMRLVQHTSVEYRYIEMTNIFDLDELAIQTFTAGDLIGLSGGNAPAPANAFNFTLRRSSRTVRNGSKRLMGVPSGEYVGGVLTSPGFIGEMNDVALSYAAEIEEPISGAIFTPVIVKRIKTPNPDYPLTSNYPFKYTLPETQIEATVVPISGCSFSLFASTQVTRKTNR